MNFDLNDEQREIKNTAREFLASRFKPEKVRELAESAAYDDDLWKRDRRARLARDRDPRGARRPGPRAWSSWRCCCEELGYACAPTPSLSNAIGGLLIAARGLRRAARALAAGARLGRGARRVAAMHRRSQPLVLDAEGAAVLLLDDGEGAAASSRATPTIEPLELIDATALLARHGRRGDPLPATWRPAIDRVAGRDRRRAHRRRPAGDGDGGRVRAGARAVRAPDRRLPGGLAPLRGRCSTTSRRRAR